MFSDDNKRTERVTLMVTPHEKMMGQAVARALDKTESDTWIWAGKSATKIRELYTVLVEAGEIT